MAARDLFYQILRGRGREFVQSHQQATPTLLYTGGREARGERGERKKGGREGRGGMEGVERGERGERWEGELVR